MSQGFSIDQEGISAGLPPISSLPSESNIGNISPPRRNESIGVASVSLDLKKQSYTTTDKKEVIVSKTAKLSTMTGKKSKKKKRPMPENHYVDQDPADEEDIVKKKQYLQNDHMWQAAKFDVNRNRQDFFNGLSEQFE